MKRILAVVFLSCTLFLLYSCEKKGSAPQSASPESAEVGGQVPDFLLKEMSGKDIRLSDFKGKIVLLEFWATWCPPCRASVPELVSLQDKFREKDFVVLAISLDTGDNVAARLSEFSRTNRINYPLIIGSEKVADQYRVRSIPSSFLINKEGKLLKQYIGYIDDLENQISGQIQKAI